MAARTKTGCLVSLTKPSISVRKEVSTASDDLAEPSLPPVLFLAMASISSTNRIAGAYFLAVAKSLCTISGPSPTYFFKNWLPSAAMKVTPASLAMALASMVLPVPGGP